MRAPWQCEPRFPLSRNFIYRFHLVSCLVAAFFPVLVLVLTAFSYCCVFICYLEVNKLWLYHRMSCLVIISLKTSPPTLININLTFSKKATITFKTNKQNSYWNLNIFPFFIILSSFFRFICFVLDDFYFGIVCDKKM